VVVVAWNDNNLPIRTDRSTERRQHGAGSVARRGRPGNIRHNGKRR
jgi:hypothetical protein